MCVLQWMVQAAVMEPGHGGKAVPLSAARWTAADRIG